MGGREPIMSNSTIKLSEPTDSFGSALDWLKTVHDNSCDEQALECGPVIDEQYKMDWVVMRGDVPSTKVTTVQPDLVHRTIDRDIFDIRDVAKILRCSVDRVSRIHKEDLAVYNGPGRPNLYLRDDLYQFLRSRRILPTISKNLLMEVLG